MHPRGVWVVETGFRPYKELSFRWRTSEAGFSLWVSDYLEDAPDDVLRDFVGTAVARAYGVERPFGRLYADYLRSDEFILKKRPVYLVRSRNVTYDTRGSVRDLADSVQRLLDAGLLEESDIDNTFFTWTQRPNYTRLGYCSQLMRVVAISSVMDAERVSEHALDYVVFHECMHLRAGYVPFNRHPHDASFHESMRAFPDAESAEAEIRGIPDMRKRDRMRLLRGSRRWRREDSYWTTGTGASARSASTTSG